jgi:hypothetical protein
MHRNLSAFIAFIALAISCVAGVKITYSARVTVAFKAEDSGAVPLEKVTAPPVYPVEMRRAGVTAEVSLRFTVRADGSTGSIKADPLGHTPVEFTKSIEEAVSRWTFVPLSGNRNRPDSPEFVKCQGLVRFDMPDE